MDIHAPEHPVLTFKQALVHLAIVTTGIVIALSLEGALEWWHHRELLHETRQNLQAEMRSNQQSIQTVLTSLGPTKTRVMHAIEVVNEASHGKTADVAATFDPSAGGLLSGISFAWLNTASYKTAQTTGALGLMEYKEAVKYSDVYDLQELYARMQDAAERDIFTAFTLGTSMLTTPTAAEVSDVKRQLLVAVGGTMPIENLATKLDELYSKALTDSH